jgi:hypothetical protein
VKTRVVTVALVAFALWPLAHRALVVAYDVNPWKLGGWAMYTAPSLSIGVALFELRDNRPMVLDAEDLTPRVRKEVRDFVARRSALGVLASPDDLGRVLFEERPQWPLMLVVADVRKLDRASARIVRQTEKHVYRGGRRIHFETAGRD